MEITFSIIFFLIVVLVSRLIFNQILNPLSTFSLIWAVVILTNLIGLIHYHNMLFETWVIIYSSTLFLVFGSIIGKIVIERSTNLRKQTTGYSLDRNTLLFYIFFLGIIGLFSAYLQWNQLFQRYGTISNIFLHGGEIYKLRVTGELVEVIPYIGSISLGGVFLSALYLAKFKKINIILLFPIIAVILRDMAAFGRVNILISIAFFATTLFVSYKKQLKDKGFILKSSLIAILILVLGIASTSLTRTFRAPTEDYKGADKSLVQTKESIIISPSVYFYLSSQVSVLNETIRYDSEKVQYPGEYSFNFIYSLLAKLSLVNPPTFYQPGYNTPYWSNTGTYLRDLYCDFGVLGIILGPLMLGFMVTYMWFYVKVNENEISVFLLSYFWNIIIMSFLIMNTRSAFVTISLFVIIGITLVHRSINARRYYANEK